MDSRNRFTRLMIAGAGGDSGKTLVSMGLIASWRRRGLRVAAFKKGPDYIDAAWLKFASGKPARNLDTYLMRREAILGSFSKFSQQADLSLIEGNRGLYDGLDAQGSHSTAELAKLLQAPVILVLDVTKVTRTAAATVLGCLRMDPKVRMAGVILNRVAGERHKQVTTEAIESICRIPVLGALPKLNVDWLPGRHLGLVTPEEHAGRPGLRRTLADLMEKHVDVNRLLAIAGSASQVEDFHIHSKSIQTPKPKSVRLAYFRDSAFTFYYPENLEALERAGARLLPISALTAEALPPCDGLYLGGGFPETHAGQLTHNRKLIKAVKEAAEAGLPIYAECGGLIYLCRSLLWGQKKYHFAGVFPMDLQMHEKPQGHGYMEVQVDRDNPFYDLGATIRGHEFHYTSILHNPGTVQTAFSVHRGSGCFGKREGLIYHRVLASYLHLHALSAPQWAESFVKLAKEYRKKGN